MPLVEFDSFNASATARMQAYKPDSTMTEYTTCRPDNDPLYCWAWVKPEFTTEVMTEEEKSSIIETYAEAVSLGMVAGEE